MILLGSSHWEISRAENPNGKIERIFKIYLKNQDFNFLPFLKTSFCNLIFDAKSGNFVWRLLKSWWRLWNFATVLMNKSRAYRFLNPDWRKLISWLRYKMVHQVPRVCRVRGKARNFNHISLRLWCSVLRRGIRQRVNHL